MPINMPAAGPGALATILKGIDTLSSLGILPGEAKEKIALMKQQQAAAEAENPMKIKAMETAGKESDIKLGQMQATDVDFKANHDIQSPLTIGKQLAVSSALDSYVKAGQMSPIDAAAKKLQIKQMTGSQLDQDTEAGPLLKLTLGKMSADATTAKGLAFGSRNAIQVSKDYETAMKPYRQLQEDVAKVEGSLGTVDKNGKPLISPQQLGDVNAAIARIYSPNHMSDATVSRTEYESIPAKFAAAAQKWLANPQDVGSRELINHIIDQAHHLANVSNKNALQELDSLDSGYSAAQDPVLQKIAMSKSQFFKQRFRKQYSTVGEKTSGSGSGFINSANASENTQTNEPSGSDIFKSTASAILEQRRAKKQ